MNEDKIKKLKKGRQEYLKNKNVLLLDLGKGLKVFKDPDQCTVSINGKVDGYYGSIYSLLEGLMEVKMTILMSEEQVGTLAEILEIIKSSRAWMEEVATALESVKNKLIL